MEWRPRRRPWMDSAGRSAQAYGTERHARRVPGGRPVQLAAPNAQLCANHVLIAIEAMSAPNGGSGAPKHARQSGAVAPRIVRLYFENSLPGQHVREPPVDPAGRDVSFGNPIQLPGEFIAQPGL